jgi:transcriptional regulator with XRE-family HTH domain
MKIVDDSPDTAALLELGRRVTRARLDRNLTQADLAREAGVSKRTVERLEAGGSTQLGNLLRVLRALGLLGRIDALVPESSPSPVEQLRLEGRRRERARRAATRTGAKSWTWGDDS